MQPTLTNPNPYTLNNPLIPSPFSNPIQLNPNVPTVVPQNPSLQLTQIQGFAPVEKFRDSTNTLWTLAKAASNSTVGIPDPKSIQIVDFWNHKFPRKDLSTEIYIYVVEGIKPPAVETEQPTRVLYQWFSTVPVFNFTPQMITDKEWLKANVYSAPIADSRMSKLLSLCKIQEEQMDAPKATNGDTPLIQAKEFSNANTGIEGNQKQNRRGN